MYDKWWKISNWFDDKSIDSSERSYSPHKGAGWSRRIHAKQLLEEACIRELSTFKGSIAAVRKMFPYKQLTPLVINRSQAIIAFPTSSPNDYSCAWIFASHVHTSNTLATVETNSMLIHFKDGTFIPVKLSYYSLEKKLARAAVIRNYCLESPVVLA